MNGDWRLERHTFGQGTFGVRCAICLADDYQTQAGEVEHKHGCDVIAAEVLRMREGGWLPPSVVQWLPWNPDDEFKGQGGMK